jgi:hypothetical protein
MAYEQELANRLRTALQDVDGVREMAMFGGLAFLVGGHMAVAASGSGGLLLRVPPERTDEYASQPHVGRFVMRGKEMSGWLRVDPEAIDADADLDRWAAVGVGYARSLPPK